MRNGYFSSIVMQSPPAVVGTGTAPYGLMQDSVHPSVTANPGGGQANAVALLGEVNVITTAGAGGVDSVKLMPSKAGYTIIVINKTTNPIQVFGAGSDTIDDIAFGTGVSQMQKSVVFYICDVAGSWRTEGLANGYAGGFQTESTQDGMTALGGGGQPGATLITRMISRFTVVVGNNDSALLPVSQPGIQLVVVNAHASNDINVFPQGADQINALGASAAFSLAHTKTAQFYCTAAGQWHSLLTA